MGLDEKIDPNNYFQEAHDPHKIHPERLRSIVTEALNTCLDDFILILYYS